MEKTKNELWDVLIYSTKDLEKKKYYYTHCISEIFQYDPMLSATVLKKAFRFGKTLATTTETKEEAITIRNKLLLFGIKSQVLQTK